MTCRSYFYVSSQTAYPIIITLNYIVIITVAKQLHGRDKNIFLMGSGILEAREVLGDVLSTNTKLAACFTCFTY